MRELRFINRQWHDPDAKYPFARTAQFTVMDEDGRSVLSGMLDAQGKPYQSPTYYFNNQTDQNFYPLSERRKR